MADRPPSPAIDLADWGLTPARIDAVAQLPATETAGLILGRVIVAVRGVRRVITIGGELDARVAGRLRHHGGDSGLPAIGDWVLVLPATGTGDDPRIEVVLPRSSKISRKAAGSRTDEQVVAANVDRLFVVVGLDSDFNPRRLERYLVAASASGVEPVVVLNKGDLCPDPSSRRAEVAALASGTKVEVTSAVTGVGLDALRALLEPGKTVSMIGSSGAGKSTLINALFGTEIMATGAVRESDDRGKHTTSHRELLRLPSGALVIDNPGIRELALWENDQELDGAFEDTFDDIVELASECRFRDCDHDAEPGCAVRQAITSELLSAERVSSYRNLQSESARLEVRQQGAAKLEAKRKLKARHHSMRKHRSRDR